jgi:putative ABC transport system permease protein
MGIGLAAVGLVGVVAHSVTRRAREFGIRVAVGAGRGAVMGLVLKEGLALCGVGAALGVGLALAAGRAISSLLVGVSPADPVVIGASVAAVLGIGVLGSAYPAWKAGRVDPVRILRAE